MEKVKEQEKYRKRNKQKRRDHERKKERGEKGNKSLLEERAFIFFSLSLCVCARRREATQLAPCLPILMGGSSLPQKGTLREE